MGDLVSLLDQAFDTHQVATSKRASIKAYLSLLLLRDTDTYLHSLRVGLRHAKAAQHLRVPAKPALYSGLLHDVGKLLISPAVLKKHTGFTEDDREAMKPHPVYSYYMTRGIHPFSGAIVLRHHRFQPNPYPEPMPQETETWTPQEQQLIEDYARTLSLVDSYDAITTRKYSGYLALTLPERRAKFLSERPQEQQQIASFFDAGVFGTTIDELYKSGP